MSVRDLPETWQDILRLDWLREFAASRPQSAGARRPGLPTVVDAYVAALRARVSGGQDAEDALEDCLFRLSSVVAELAADVSYDTLPSVVAQISRRVRSRAMQVSPLIDAAIQARSCPSAEIGRLADAAAQNAAAIRQLCA